MRKPGRLLEKELQKAVFAAKHAYNHGYVDAVKRTLDLEYDKQKDREYDRTRSRFLSRVHPLAQGGFSFRMGHINSDFKRTDWPAVKKDIKNLYLGVRRDDFKSVFEDATWLNAPNTVKIVDKVGEFSWPGVLHEGFFHGVIPHTVKLFSRKKPFEIASERKGKDVVLTFYGTRARASATGKKGLRLIKQIVGYFNGRLKEQRVKENSRISITLPFKIRSDLATGGHFTQEELKRLREK